MNYWTFCCVFAHISYTVKYYPKLFLQTYRIHPREFIFHKAVFYVSQFWSYRQIMTQEVQKFMNLLQSTYLFLIF